MTNIIGVDIDTQIDFAEKQGSLFVPVPDQTKKNIELISQSLQMVIGSVDYHGPDAWEFQENGGPFPRHCEKGTVGALKIKESLRPKTRFIPMSAPSQAEIGENVVNQGNRVLTPEHIAKELLDQKYTIIFEKEVYSMFANPNAEPAIKAIVNALGETRDQLFAVYGYCTGGYCVDATALGLKQRGYDTAIVLDATAPLNAETDSEGRQGLARTIAMAQEHGIKLITTAELLNLNR